MSLDATRLSLGGGGEYDLELFMDYDRIPVRPGDVQRCLHLHGLLGGHNGKNAYMERGNANLLVVRVLSDLQKKKVPFRIVSFIGGEFTACAIARDAVCRISYPGSFRETVEKTITEWAVLFKNELAVPDPYVELTLEVPEEKEDETIADADRRKSVQKLLEHSLSLAQIGTLILDADGKVYKINRAGREILWLDDSVPYSEISLTQDPGENPKEYTVSFGGQMRRIVADIYHVGMDRCDRLMLFGSAELRTDLSDGILGLKTQRDLDRIVGNSAPILQLKKNIRLIAPSPSNVLITGESGTGKELAARAIHGESLRKNGPFVAVNCAALPESLLESELFGYVKGAFTGASSGGKKGLLETAEGGTFFLDEIGDMPLPIQIKLLRVLEQREILRLGSNNPIPINVRFVFATNRDLEEMVREKTFREDFFYRINVVPLSLPPLRERHGDIRLIAETFIRRFSVSFRCQRGFLAASGEL